MKVEFNSIEEARAFARLILQDAPMVAPMSNWGIPFPYSLAEASAMLQAVRNGHKLQAIRILRSLTGEGLKECKDAVEAWY